MKDKRVIIISIILILCIIGVIYLTSLSLNAFNERFYEREFKKYNIYGEFPDKDIDRINSGLLLYLKGKGDVFDEEFFNQEEIDHLRDVKNLFDRMYVAYYSLIITLVLLIIILFLLSKKNFLRNLGMVLFFSGLFTLFFTIILLVLIKLDFGGFFTNFHYMFFPQGGWLFDSSENLVRLYPSGFFYDMVRNIFVSILFYGNILIGVGILLFTKK